jgi:Flp pilus assembly pilin Flp
MRAGAGQYIGAGRRVGAGRRAREWVGWRIRGAGLRPTGRQRDAGAAAVEFALVATLVAGAAVAVVATGAQIEWPLETLAALFDGLAGFSG